jgi:polysaccharide pyruvyl transferase WcaK-like protein
LPCSIGLNRQGVPAPSTCNSESKMQKIKIMILHDSMPEKNRLINLGDRALADGFYTILNHNFDCEIISGGRKNFPYFTIKKFKQLHTEIEILNEFERFLNTMLLKQNGARLRYEKRIQKFISAYPLFNNQLFGKLNARFSKKYTRGISETLYPFIFRQSVFMDQICKIQSADVVISNSGGLFSDHLEFYLPSYLFELFLAKKLGKTVISMNQSISIKKPINRKMLFQIYSMMDFHMTREAISMAELVDMGIPGERVIASCDSAFAADFTVTEPDIQRILEKNNLTAGGVGIAIRGDRKVDYQKLKNLIDLVRQKYQKKIYFFSTCKAHDMAVFKALSKSSGIFLLQDENNYKLLTQQMKYLDLIITDRYHVAIFGIIANVPILAFNPQTIKMKGLFELIDYPFPVLSHETFQANELAEIIGQVFGRKDEIKKKFAKAYQQLREKALNDIKKIPQYFSKQVHENLSDQC